MMTLIYDGLDIAVYFDYLSDDGIVFSFSGFDAHKTQRHRYADGFIQSLGLSGVFFCAKDNHWWQTKELWEAIEVVNVYTRNIKKRISYGQSMGGYGALLASKHLKSFALVTAPQTCISDKSLPLHPVWRENIERFHLVRDDVADLIQYNLGTIIIYDNLCDIDRRHFAHISKKKGVLGIRVSFGTHYIPKALVEMGLFSKIITNLMLNDNFSVQHIRREIRENRLLSKTYVEAILSAVKKRGLNSNLYNMIKIKLTNDLLSYNHHQKNINLFECIVNEIEINKYVSKINVGEVELISLNKQVVYYDKDLNILQSLSNDPAFIFTLPKVKIGKIIIEIYSMIDDIAIIYFNERAEESFSENRALRLKLSKGHNMLKFDVSCIDLDRKVRFDPMRTNGVFLIKSFYFEELL